jgi:hypothetical protein
MGFSFAGIREELDSERFGKLFQRLKADIPYLAPFSGWMDLLTFLHDQTRGYRRKDRILWRLIQVYRQGGEYACLSSFFLEVFTPAIGKLRRRGLKQCPDYGDKDLAQDMGIALLGIIGETKITAEKVAVRIVGRLQNRVKAMLDDRMAEAALIHGGDDALALIPATGDESDPLGDPMASLLKILDILNVKDAGGLLDHLVQARVITKEDRKLIGKTVVEGKSLKEAVTRPEDYERLKKRRERAMKAVRRHLLNLLKLDGE